MKFIIKPTDPAKLDADVLIVTYPEINKISKTGTPFAELLNESISREQFENKENQFLILNSRGLIAAYKIIIIAAADLDILDNFNIQNLMAKAARKAIELKPAKIGIVIPDDWIKKLGASRIASNIVEAISLASYNFLKYKSEEEQKKIRLADEVILCLSANKLDAAENGIQKGVIFAEAVNFARDLVNEPSSETTPSYLAETALNIAKTSKETVKATVLNKEEIKKLGMEAFLGVARGSYEDPKFIILQYKNKKPKKRIVLIGKGITFDTGGLSLKGAEHMETMKLDMAGAASILAVFKALPLLMPEIEVYGLIAACENMPGGRALKPGDILKAMNGKTIEVLNTDAEGRLTLADALSYAVMKIKPDEIIDLATLTGACMVALGQDISGMWGNNQKLISELNKSASESGELIWQMPLHDNYKELIKSHIADIKNIQTGKYGGAITAALFLSEFVANIPWVHFDIAGPSFMEKVTPLTSYGGSGFGVRLLLNYLSSI